MRVAIIGQYPKEKNLEKQFFTGIMRVVHGLAQELGTYSDIKVETVSERLKRQKGFGPYLRGRLSFLRNLLQSEAEIFHIHGVSFSTFLSLVVTKLKRKKAIYTVHGLVSREMKLGYYYSPFSLFFEFSLIKYSNRITTPSEKMRRMIVRDYDVDKGKISVIENGVDLSFVENTVTKTKRNKHVLLFVGGTRTVKGLPFLLESIKVLREKKKDVVLLIVGKKGDQHNILTSEYSYLLQEGYVRFLGRVSEHELNSIYGNAETIILPSIYEPFGLVALEAMARGKAVIVSDRVGVSSMITNGKDGIIVPYGEVPYLAKEINFLLQNRVEREKIGRNAKKTAKEYAWNKVARKYVKCYRELLL